MAAKDDLKIWANTVSIDPIYNTPNTLGISDDLWDNGWLRLNPVNAQHLNKLLQLLTTAVKNETLTPDLNLSDVTNVATALSNLGGLDKASNLADLPNKVTARANLDVYQRSLNLSDIPSASVARDNLGLNTDTLFNTFFDKVYPVGTVYENKTNSGNPNTYLGRGTWVAEGAGRVAIGAGSGNDGTETIAFTAGTTGGKYKHTLTINEMPSHSHTLPSSSDPNSGTTHLEDADGSGTLSSPLTGSTGGGLPHNNTQPYIVYYRWLRTS